MTLLRPLMLTVLAVMLFSIPSACPPYYVMLNAYVQHPGVNFTNDELKRLNLSDLKDTSNQAIVDKRIDRFYAEYSRVGDVKRTSVGGSYGYNMVKEYTVQEAYKLMTDTLLSQLNMGDTLFMRYYVNNSHRIVKTEDDEFFFHAFEKFILRKNYVISSQAVVDLKRSPDDAGMIAYPSPASNEVSVKFAVKEPISGHITILNTLGQIIAEVDHENLMQPYTFNIDKEPAGNYYMRAEVDGEFFTRKFVKE